jgi:hypothetical protein
MEYLKSCDLPTAAEGDRDWHGTFARRRIALHCVLSFFVESLVYFSSCSSFSRRNFIANSAWQGGRGGCMDDEWAFSFLFGATVHRAEGCPIAMCSNFSADEIHTLPNK